VKCGRGVREMFLSLILFNLYSECLIKEVLEGLEDFKMEGQVIRTVKYADGIVLLAEKVLHWMSDRITQTGTCCGMELDKEKSEVMKISREPSQLQIMTDQKQVDNLEQFKYLSSMMINEARYTHEIKSGVTMKKSAFNRKKSIFISKLDLDLRKKLVKSHN
jgi:hypothetical protein